MNQEGLALLKSFEGCKLTAYRDIVGVLTIAYGHTGPDVYEGQEIDQKTADYMLGADLNRFEDKVNALVTAPINENQLSALICFAYNVGVGALKKSHLLIKLNAEDYAGAADEFLRWDKAQGKVIPGLARRRAAERELFLS